MRTFQTKELEQFLEVLSTAAQLRGKYDQLLEEVERLRVDNRALLEENIKLKYNKENNNVHQPQNSN